MVPPSPLLAGREQHGPLRRIVQRPTVHLLPHAIDPPSQICSHAFGLGDLAYGFNRSVYESAGYKLAFLVRSGRGTRRPAIVLTSTLDDEQLAQHIADGYNFACVRRE